MEITVDSIWAKAQRLTPSDRLALSRRLSESLTETEAERCARVEKEMSRFFGGWSHDPRSTEDVMNQIRAGRTKNTFPEF